MAEQAPKFQSKTFTKVGEDGETKELVTYSPADEVRLVFEGWREKTGGSKSAKSSTPAS